MCQSAENSDLKSGDDSAASTTTTTTTAETTTTTEEPVAPLTNEALLLEASKPEESLKSSQNFGYFKTCSYYLMNQAQLFQGSEYQAKIALVHTTGQMSVGWYILVRFCWFLAFKQPLIFEVILHKLLFAWIVFVSTQEMVNYKLLLRLVNLTE